MSSFSEPLPSLASVFGMLCILLTMCVQNGCWSSYNLQVSSNQSGLSPAEQPLTGCFLFFTSFWVNSRECALRVKIPGDHPVLKYSNQLIWYQHPCHGQSNWGHIFLILMFNHSGHYLKLLTSIRLILCIVLPQCCVPVSLVIVQCNKCISFSRSCREPVKYLAWCLSGSAVESSVVLFPDFQWKGQWGQHSLQGSQSEPQSHRQPSPDSVSHPILHKYHRRFQCISSCLW